MNELEAKIINNTFRYGNVTVDSDIEKIFTKIVMTQVTERSYTNLTSDLNRFYKFKEWWLTVSWKYLYSESSTFIRRFLQANKSKNAGTRIDDYLSWLDQETPKYKNMMIVLDKRFGTNLRYTSFDSLSSYYEGPEYINWSTKNIDYIINNITSYSETNAIIWLGKGTYYVTRNNILVCQESELSSTILDKCFAIMIKFAQKKGLTLEQAKLIMETMTYDKSLLTPEEETTLQSFLFTYELEEHIDRIKDRLKYQMRECDSNLSTILRNYELGLHQKQELMEFNNYITGNLKQTMYEMDDLINSYKKLNYISHTHLQINGDYLEIIIYTKILPVLYMDLNILKSTLNSGGYELSNTEKELFLQMIEEENLTLAVAPCKTKLCVPISRGRERRIEHSSPTGMQINGHASYNCLGTFGPTVIESFTQFNLKKLVALIIQYLQSISPADLAGKKSINNPIIIDEDGETIKYVYSSAHKWLEGKKLSEIQYNTVGGFSR